MEKLDGLKSYESYLELTNFSVCTQKMYLRTITNFYEWRLEQCKSGKLKQEDAQQYLLMRVKSGKSWLRILIKLPPPMLKLFDPLILTV